MNRKRNLWIFIGIVIFVNVLVSGFVLMQPSAKDILVTALNTAETITNGHAIVTVEVNSPDKDVSGTVEVWARRGADEPGAFRIEVHESSDAKTQGAVIVSNGETLWAYSPTEHKVFVGTPEEAQSMMGAKGPMSENFGGFYPGKDAMLEDGEYDHPENAEEAVQKLAEYFNIAKSGRETVAAQTAQQLKLEPIAEQMPAEYAAVGGFINLWIGQESSLPLALSYTGGSLGSFSASVVELEVNTGVDETRFTFTVPEDAEVVTFADLEPQSLTLEEAGETAEFAFLTPAETPPGATLVDILEVRGAIILRYTLPAGGSFTISQGIAGEKNADEGKPAKASQAVVVRGSTGQLFESEDGAKVLLTWTESDLRYSVAGDLNAEDALAVAESLE